MCDKHLRVKRVSENIWDWLFIYYRDYSPIMEEVGKFAFTYSSNGYQLKLRIQVLDHLKLIRYSVTHPFKYQTEHYNEILDLINERHVNTVIGRFDLNKENGEISFNFWNSYDEEKLDLDEIDRGIGVTMICFTMIRSDKKGAWK